MRNHGRNGVHLFAGFDKDEELADYLDALIPPLMCHDPVRFPKALSYHLASPSQIDVCGVIQQLC